MIRIVLILTAKDVNISSILVASFAVLAMIIITIAVIFWARQGRLIIYQFHKCFCFNTLDYIVYSINKIN